MSEDKNICIDCKRDFRATRDWQRFCTPVCRLRSHRRKQREIEASVVEQNRVASASVL
ncbi:hypothetical protein [Limnoglobus roseus]|uniref:Uncharacterized protein n=1 Tax=Limnoglobus roseus TaxID=2598579 RepID=A0A5C1AMU6_9BACT|nr:hypothetical protein [Limnoglobus roseus]QEL19306.1 hypothetical protein PX52LOC_06371 [Limnoglobus roseus]